MIDYDHRSDFLPTSLSLIPPLENIQEKKECLTPTVKGSVRGIFAGMICVHGEIIANQYKIVPSDHLYEFFFFKLIHLGRMMFHPPIGVELG